MATKAKKKNQNFGDRAVKTFTTLIAILAVLAICVIGYSIYFYNNSPPQTVSTTYADALAFAEDTTYVFEANVMTNKNKNGIEIAEFKANYYTDVLVPVTASAIKNVYSSGIQWKGKPQFNEPLTTNLFGWSSTWQITPQNAFMYNYTDGIGYAAVNALSPDDSWIIDYATSTPYEDLTGYEHNLARLVQRGTVRTGTGEFGWGLYYEQNIFAMIKAIMGAAYSMPVGTYVLQFDLSPFFTPMIYNQQTTQFDIASQTGDMYTFVNVLVNKSENGLAQANQSIFNSVGNNPTFAIAGVDKSAYWRDATHYTLTEEAFVFSPIAGSEFQYLGALKPAAITYLAAFSGTYIEISIDLDSALLANAQVIFAGLADDAFGDLKISKLTIGSDGPATFDLNGFRGNVIAGNDITLIGGAL